MNTHDGGPCRAITRPSAMTKKCIFPFLLTCLTTLSTIKIYVFQLCVASSSTAQTLFWRR